MFVDLAADAEHMVIVTDFRQRTDEGDRVLSYAPDLVEALGRDTLRRHVTNVALFERDTRLTPTRRAEQRAKLEEFLAPFNDRTIVVIPTSDVDDTGETQQAATVCWHVFNAPDALGNMRGCFYETPYGTVMPVFPRSPWLKELQKWQQAKWLQRAYGVATRAEEISTCEVSLSLRWGAYQLSSMFVVPVAVDIESIEGTELITAIGVSDGYKSVSIPWDAFLPAGASRAEPALVDQLYGPECKAWLTALLAADTPKYFHNHTFDVPRLRRAGFEINGEIFDTFAASGVCYPELRHGLQHAVAREIACPPWKSLWHPKLKGITRDDVEYWTCDPEALRKYNAQDAYYTWWLAYHLRRKMGLAV